jgi:hypothetical protein
MSTRTGLGIRTRRVFVSYSHRDEEWKDRLVGHLRVLARKGEIDPWHDRRIEAGEDWKAQIEAAIDRADTALLLISTDFLNSAFIQEEEVARILRHRAGKGLRVIPVIVRPCAWTGVDWLRDLQARPVDGRPLSSAQVHEAESDLAALALEIFPRPAWTGQFKAAARTLRQFTATGSTLPGFGLALLPVILVAALVVLSMGIRVDTPVQLDVIARAVSFTVAEGGRVPLLNNSTPFSMLIIEECDAVSFPRLNIALDDAEPVTSSGAVTLRCDPRVPGSKIVVRGSRAGKSADLINAGLSFPTGPTAELGSLGRLAAEPGDRVAFELTDANPPAIRVALSRNASFDFSLRKGVNFEITSEFADLDGVATPPDPDGVATYVANLPDSNAERVATVTSGRGVNLVVAPADDPTLAALFRADIDIPIESLSLFQLSDVDDRFISTAISGTLKYPRWPDIPEVPINTGDNVSLRALEGFRLTQMWIDTQNAALWFSFHGEAAMVTTAGKDRRLTLFNRVLSNTTAQILALIVVVAVQFVWFRRYRRPSMRMVTVR